MSSFDFSGGNGRGLGKVPFWKDKYQISWCYHCETAVIQCPACHNTSCNAGGCQECHSTFQDFHQAKVTVTNYLTDEESRIYDKALQTSAIHLGELGPRAQRN